ncbi:MAG: hypothetical protein WBW41_09940 [Verrucomicrobiia bacterium]
MQEIQTFSPGESRLSYLLFAPVIVWIGETLSRHFWAIFNIVCAFVTFSGCFRFDERRNGDTRRTASVMLFTGDGWARGLERAAGIGGVLRPASTDNLAPGL